MMTDRMRDLPQQKYDARLAADQDKELADALVALGILKFSIHTDSEYRYMFRSTGFTASFIVRDWRVAGAVMEKWEASDEWSPHGCAEAIVLRKDDSIPRAIIEAGVAALQEQNSG